MANTITSFDLDLSSISGSGETRSFIIAGDRGSEFILEIKNEDSYYYNFVTNKFQAAQADLEASIAGNGFTGNITFPKVSDDDQYDISLYAKPGTEHTKYTEVRFLDGSLDINSSTGSNSLMMKKVIYQYLDVTLTITPFSLSGNVECGSVVSDTVVIARGKGRSKTNFSISCAPTTATKSYQLLKQPTVNDLFSYVQPVVGSSPLTLPGENIYPAITAQANVGSSPVSNSDTVTMEEDVSAAVSAKDRVLGFTSAADAVVTTVASVSGDEITLSRNISVGAGATLSFYNQKHYRWPVNNYVHLIKPGMYVKDGTNITSIGDYLDITTLNEGTETETKIRKEFVEAADGAGNIPTVSQGVVTVLAGNLIFTDQQLATFGGNTLTVGGFGTSQFLALHDYDTVWTDLAATLNTITTTTTAAVNKSTSVAIADRGGILNGSVVSGIGIDASVADPTVSSGASSADGAGTIVLSAAQTLEKGRTLTFAGSGTTVTITGFVEVKKSGTANQTIRFNIDNFVSIT